MSTAPNMATITAALERSLQKCSLSHHQAVISSDSHGVALPNSSSSSSNSNSNSNGQQQTHLLQPQTTLDLNSHISLPYHWEQCLDLKTGEIYYINWRNGMKAKEDPRSTSEDQYSEDYYYYSDDDDDSSYDSEESSTESSNNNNNNKNFANMEAQQEEEEEDHVLVVAGCKSCLMYFMVPKHLEDCPKCSTGQLLHFDRSENDIP